VLWHVTDSYCEAAAQNSGDAYCQQRDQQMLPCLTLTVKHYHPHPSCIHLTKISKTLTQTKARAFNKLKSIDFIGSVAKGFYRLSPSMDQAHRSVRNTFTGGLHKSSWSLWWHWRRGHQTNGSDSYRKRRDRLNWQDPKSCDVHGNVSFDLCGLWSRLIRSAWF